MGFPDPSRPSTATRFIGTLSRPRARNRAQISCYRRPRLKQGHSTNEHPVRRGRCIASSTTTPALSRMKTPVEQ